MFYMIAEKKNFEICEKIIEILHKEEVTVAQSHAILDYVKNKITRDTKVGELIKMDYGDLVK